MDEQPALLIQACTLENLSQEGVCMAPVWVEKPQQVLPPLSLADGTVVAFAIVAVWAVGLKARLVFRAARMGAF